MEKERNYNAASKSRPGDQPSHPRLVAGKEEGRRTDQGKRADYYPVPSSRSKTSPSSNPRAALRAEQGERMFITGEVEYEHLLCDLKALGLGLKQLPAEENQVMFNPGEENEELGDLDSMLRGEEKVG